ncbi:hypothetical protein PVAP13_1NG183900 [Panicum virgatum]|uniref:Uncharacterized protein n=1 Tax=Panicum virgatum TaxID=38727 RepID=A0A8T0WYM6_PANVG|nr:hypothetical protein PVAP13_1NG183900 [Panicum virgatum]
MLSAARDVICAEYEGLISTSDKVGLLAMQFLENFSGMSFMPSLDEYNSSVLEYLVFHTKNMAKFLKICNKMGLK